MAAAHKVILTKAQKHKSCKSHFAFVCFMWTWTSSKNIAIQLKAAITLFMKKSELPISIAGWSCEILNRLKPWSNIFDKVLPGDISDTNKKRIFH